MGIGMQYVFQLLLTEEKPEVGHDHYHIRRFLDQILSCYTLSFRRLHRRLYRYLSSRGAVQPLNERPPLVYVDTGRSRFHLRYFSDISPAGGKREEVCIKKVCV